MKWIKVMYVMTTTYAGSFRRPARNIEVRGTFMLPEDKLEDSFDLMRKVLTYYFEQKGYSELLPWFKIPPELFDTHGVEVFREIKEPEACKTVLEVIDKDYDRYGGYVEEIILPKDWYSKTSKELLEIVKSQLTEEGRKRHLGRWLGYSKTEEEYRRDD